MKKNISIRMRLRNHIVTWKEEEFPKEDKMVEEFIPEEEEEAEEEK